MQRLETERLVLYYPQGTKERALHVAGRLEYCRRELEKHQLKKNDISTDKAVFVLPLLPYNNAYVQPPFTQRQIAVVPQYNTAIDLFEQFNIPPDPGTIGCHEMVHDFHSRQMRGGAAAIHHVFGNYYSPQQGFDSWFWEGVAVYYETRLTGLGRLHNAYFDGHFHAGFAGHTINGGDFSAFQRNTPFGAQYLVGAHFIDFITREYGEDKLWQVINAHAGGIIFPMNVNGSFKAAYGKTLTTLIEEFDADTKKRYPVRVRPPEQQVLRDLPSSAVFYRGRSGHTILLSGGPDDYARYTVYAPDGTELLTHRLNDLGVARRIVGSTVGMVSGLSMTPDGKHLYFVIVDTGPVYSESHLMHLDIERDDLEIVEQNLNGSGGSVSPDGKRYYYSHAESLSLALYCYDLTSHQVTQLRPHVVGAYPSNPVVSPDGKRLLVTEASDAGVRLALYDADNGQRLASVNSPPGVTLQPSWLDDQHVLYSGSDGRYMQVFETDLRSDTFRPLTAVPYVAARPYSDGHQVQFLNRIGWKWTLDQTAYLPQPAAAASTTAVSAGDPVLVVKDVDVPKVTRVPLSAANALAAPTEPPTANEELSDRDPAPAQQEAPPAAALAPATTAPSAVAPAAVAPPAPKQTGEFVSASYSMHQTPQDVQVKVLSEGSYSAFDQLFLPEKWGPYIISRQDNGTAYGAFVTGKDRLGYQAWALSAAYDTKAKLPSVSVSYLNNFAAPWAISGDFAFIGRREAKTEDLVPAVDEPVRIRETVADLMLSRQWYGSTFVGLGGRYIDSDYQLESAKVSIAQQRFVGPMAAFGYTTFDGTAYAGSKLGFGLNATGTFFPKQASTADFNLTDARGELAVPVPLPFWKRHKLILDGVGRGLLGCPADTSLLQIGGGGNSTPLENAGQDKYNPESQLASGVLPASLRFSEPLRGFENLALFGRYAVIATATYNAPLIFDVGSATSLRFFPAFFLRQIDLQLFGTGATLIDEGREKPIAVGAAAIVRTNFWLIPLSFTFQESRRLTYDEKFSFFFGLSAD